MDKTSFFNDYVNENEIDEKELKNADDYLRKFTFRINGCKSIDE